MLGTRLNKFLESIPPTVFTIYVQKHLCKYKKLNHFVTKSDCCFSVITLCNRVR
jgi:hypothetical protein